MTRWIAVLSLLLVVVAIVAPALAPAVAYAATGEMPNGGLPNLPWAQIWGWIKSWGPMIIYLIDAVVTALNSGGSDPSGTPNPPPPPPPPGNPTTIDPSVDGATPIAWCGGFAASVCA